MNPIQALLNEFVDKGLCHGCNVLVTKDGEEAFYGQAGVRHHLSRIPFSRDTLMYMYSMTKVVNAVAALTLYEKGAFTLDTPISKYIPEFADTPVCIEENGEAKLVKAKRQLTFRDVFTMTSGIPYPFGGTSVVAQAVDGYYQKAYDELCDGACAGAPVTALSFAKKVASCPLMFQPGQTWLYGLSSDVMGGLICAITGKGLYEYYKEAIFDKLSMEDTFFRLPDEKRSRIAKRYRVDKDGLKPTDDAQSVIGMTDNPTFEAGGAGLISTVDDYTRFALALMHGGEGVIRPDTVALMTGDKLNLEQKKGFNWLSERGFTYGLTVRIRQGGQPSDYNEGAGAFGWNGACGTSLRIDPQRGVTTVFGVQRMPAQHELFLPQLTHAVADHLGFKE